MQVCDQSTTIPLSCSFLLIHFPSYGMQFLQGKKLSYWVGCPWDASGHILLWGPPQDAVGCRGMFALVLRVRPPILLLWPWCSQGCFSRFPPNFPLLVPFEYTFPEVPAPWLQGLAMPCSECAGICWNWHGVALAALWRGCPESLLPVPGHKHLLQLYKIYGMLSLVLLSRPFFWRT